MSAVIEVIELQVPPEEAERLCAHRHALNEAVRANTAGYVGSVLVRVDANNWLLIVEFTDRSALDEISQWVRGRSDFKAFMGCAEMPPVVHIGAIVVDDRA
jgi:quinol monooxygenase YgiN